MVKKINAVLGLAIIVSLLVHVFYEIYSFLTFYYNPELTKFVSHFVMIPGLLHILLSAFIVFFSHDKGKGMRYVALNMRTLLQRISAAAITVMLFLHVHTMTLMMQVKETNGTLFIILMIVQLLFFASVFFHVAVSAGNALITLGVIASEKARKRTDVIIWIFCSLSFAAASVIVVKTQIALLISAGGAG